MRIIENDKFNNIMWWEKVKIPFPTTLNPIYYFTLQGTAFR